MDIRRIAEETVQQVTGEVEMVSEFATNDVVLDIRSPEEQENSPLKLEGVDVKELPFYKLSTQFGDLDNSKTYLLYCERGYDESFYKHYIYVNKALIT